MSAPVAAHDEQHAHAEAKLIAEDPLKWKIPAVGEKGGKFGTAAPEPPVKEGHMAFGTHGQ